MEQGSEIRTSLAGVSAVLAADNAGLQSTVGAPVRFPAEDGGGSLAVMAQHDLDAALQLLADRAQYITGANGAAIALRRSGKNDMQCRASSGENVPELGALLSTEFGISGESVRTRKPLRCDDAERDPRVNREGCRQLGIASVVVMPVVNDDEVMGVFELFSGKTNAFGERDLSALQRLSEMVETAVKLARAAEVVLPLMKNDELPDAKDFSSGTGAAERTSNAGDSTSEMSLGKSGGVPSKSTPVAEPKTGLPAKDATSSIENIRATAETGIAATASAALSAKNVLPKKPLFWSAASGIVNDAVKPAEADQSHVPPVLRNLRTCEACGFPVSPGRALCVECEEKRWRGQLKRPGAVTPPANAVPKAPAADILKAGVIAKDVKNGESAPGTPRGPVAHLLAVAAQSAAAAAPARESVEVAVAAVASPPVAPSPVQVIVRESISAPASPVIEAPKPEASDFVLSAGLEPSESWLAVNIYVILVVLLVGAAVAATILLH